MDTLTIHLDAETSERLARRAREEGVSPEAYAAEVVAETVADDGFPTRSMISDDRC